MNNSAPELTLIEEAIAAAGAHGLEGRLVGNNAKSPDRDLDLDPDLKIEIGRGRKKVTYVAEVKRYVNVQNLGSVALQLKERKDNPLLVTTYVSPPLATRLRELDVEFMDTAGNASLNRGPLLVWATGEKPSTKLTSPEVGRAFQPGGLRVLFALLSNPQSTRRPFRDLAVMAGVSLGTVANVFADLDQMGHLIELDDRHDTRRLTKEEGLVRQWAESYARTLRPKTLLGRFYAASISNWEKWNLDAAKSLWGGEPAGSLLTNGYLRPGELTIYAERLPSMLIATQKLRKNPEPGETAVVEIRKRFWNFGSDDTPGSVVPPLLVYADLLAIGDARCLETAGMVYKKYVARPLQK